MSLSCFHLPKAPSLRVSSRKPAAANFPSTVEVVQGDLTNPSTFPSLFSSVDRVFLYAIPRAPLPAVCEAMRSAGVKRVVQLSSKWVVSEPGGLFAKTHAIVEDAIKSAGLSYTFIRGGCFAHNALNLWLPQIRQDWNGVVGLPRRALGAGGSAGPGSGSGGGIDYG